MMPDTTSPFARLEREVEKLREQNRRLKAAIARVRKMIPYDKDWLLKDNVLDELRLRK